MQAAHEHLKLDLKNKWWCYRCGFWWGWWFGDGYAKNSDEDGDIEDEDSKNDDEQINDTANETFINPSQLESEVVEFDIFVKCKDHWLRNSESKKLRTLKISG